MNKNVSSSVSEAALEGSSWSGVGETIDVGIASFLFSQAARLAEYGQTAPK
jgi:hypothetical protein